MVGIDAVSYQTVPDAIARFVERKKQASGAHFTSVSVTGADEAIETTCIDCGGTIDFRVGTVVAWVSFSPDGLGTPQTGTIGTVTSLFAERISQVLAGHQPTERVQ